MKIYCRCLTLKIIWAVKDGDRNSEMDLINDLFLFEQQFRFLRMQVSQATQNQILVACPWCPWFQCSCFSGLSAHSREVSAPYPFLKAFPLPHLWSALSLAIQKKWPGMPICWPNGHPIAVRFWEGALLEAIGSATWWDGGGLESWSRQMMNRTEGFKGQKLWFSKEILWSWFVYCCLANQQIQYQL